MRIRLPVLACVLPIFFATSLRADPIAAGFDLFEILTAENTFGDPYVIPTGFFGPGSDPFTGVVSFAGDPLGTSSFCPGDLLATTAMILRRTVQADPESGTPNVPIELVQLSLMSVSPITVTYSGGQNPELWDVRMTLSPVPPQSPGLCHFEHQFPNGGFLLHNLPLNPRFDFVRRSDSQTRTVDFAASPSFDANRNGLPMESHGAARAPGHRM